MNKFIIVSVTYCGYEFYSFLTDQEKDSFWLDFVTFHGAWKNSSMRTGEFRGRDICFYVDQNFYLFGADEFFKYGLTNTPWRENKYKILE